MTNTDQHSQTPKGSGAVEHYDAVIIGAGVGGLYALHHLRAMGLAVRVFDGAAGVGGTWWWNRYPGARVDGPGSPFTATRSRRSRAGMELGRDPARSAVGAGLSRVRL